MEQKQNQMVALTPQVLAMQEQFAMAAESAKDMQLQENACAAFQAVVVVSQLRMALTDEVMNQVFMPLMNTKIGFRTDRDPNRPGKGGPVTPYPVNVVRDCIIDAVAIGLNPTGNQFNIISGSMYPTKEGYTALLKKVGCKYYISVGQDTQPADAKYAEIACKIAFEYNGDKNAFTITANVKKDSYSSYDQLKGKAERRAKKALYEYLTGCDFGDADDESSAPIDKRAAERQERANAGVLIEPEPMTQGNTQQGAGDWKEKMAQQQGAAKQPGF